MAQLWHKFRKQTCLGKLGVAVGMLSIGGVAAVVLPAGAAAGVGVATAAAVGNIVGGVGGNLFSSCMDRWFPDHSLDPSEKLNHDIELVVGHAIEGVMRELIKNGSRHTGLYKHLLKKEVSEVWHQMMIEHDPQTALDLPEPQELLVAAAEARETGNGDKLPPCLDDATWKAWLVRLDSRAGVMFPEACLDELAPALVARMYRHLVEALKADFEQDGKAYAAIQMATSHSVLAIVRSVPKKLDEMSLALAAIERKIDKTLNAIRPNLSRSDWDRLDARFHSLHRGFHHVHAHLGAAEQRITKEIRERTAEVLAKVDERDQQLVDRLLSQLSEKDQQIGSMRVQLQDAVRRLSDAGQAGDASAAKKLEVLRAGGDSKLLGDFLDDQLAAQSNRPTVDLLRERAALAYVNADLVRARECYAGVLALMSKDHEANFWLGRIGLFLHEPNEAQRRFERLLELSAEDDPWRARALVRLSDVAKHRGNLAEARKRGDESLAVARQIVERFGESPEALRDVSISLEKVADAELALNGTGESVLAGYRESLGICRQIVERFGESPEALRDVSISLEKVADAERALTGPTEAVLAGHRESLDICRDIAKRFGESPESLRDVSISLEKVADAERALTGPGEAVLAGYRESLGIARRIVERFGESPQALRDVSVSLNKVADAELALSGPGEAVLAGYRESLGIARRIVERFGESPQALRDVSVSLQRTGLTQALLGDKAAGLADAREALRLLAEIGRRWGMIPQIVKDIEQTKALIARIEAM